MEACALLYLLMRANFEYTSRRAITRVSAYALTFKVLDVTS